MSEILSFGKNSYLKKVIKTQGSIICRGEIYQEIIDEALKKFEIGFAKVIEKAQSGQTQRSKADKVQITSFSLLFEMPSISITYKELFIQLICGLKSKRGEGTELLLHIIDYAKQNGYNRLSLQSLNEKKLLEWYLYHGFKIVEVLNEGSEIKGFKLSMDLK